MAIVHTIYAFILGGEVKDVTMGEFYESNQAAKNIYGQGAFAVEVTQIPVEIGDKYAEDGRFYRENKNGETVEIEPWPTEAEEIDLLRRENKSMQAQMNILMAALTDAVEMMEGEDE